jgi:hypothetical protein
VDRDARSIPRPRINDPDDSVVSPPSFIVHCDQIAATQFGANLRKQRTAPADIGSNGVL